MWMTHFWFRAADFQRNRNILKYPEYFRSSLFFVLEDVQGCFMAKEVFIILDNTVGQSQGGEK